MKPKRSLQSCKHGVKVDIRRDFRGQPLGSIRHEYECAIGQFRGPKLPEYCKAACPKWEPREESERSGES